MTVNELIKELEFQVENGKGKWEIKFSPFMATDLKPINRVSAVYGEDRYVELEP